MRIRPTAENAARRGKETGKTRPKMHAHLGLSFREFGFRNLVRFYRYQLAGYAPLTAAVLERTNFNNDARVGAFFWRGVGVAARRPPMSGNDGSAATRPRLPGGRGGLVGVASLEGNTLTHCSSSSNLSQTREPTHPHLSADPQRYYGLCRQPIGTSYL